MVRAGATFALLMMVSVGAMPAVQYQYSNPAEGPDPASTSARSLDSLDGAVPGERPSGGFAPPPGPSTDGFSPSDILVNTFATNNQLDIDAAVDAGGTIWIAYFSNDPAGLCVDASNDVRVSKSIDGGASFSEVACFGFAGSTQNDPSIAVTGSGASAKILVVFTRGTGANDVYVVRSTDGGVIWDPASGIATGAAPQQAADVAWDDGGTYAIVPYQEDIGAGNWDVLTRRSTDSGASWVGGPAVAISARAELRPSVDASGSAGSAVAHIAYNDTITGSDSNIVYRQLTGGFSAAGSTTTLDSTSALLSFNSRGLTLDEEGDPFVVWTDRVSDTDWRVKLRRSQNGGSSWLSELAVASFSRDENAAVAVAGDADGTELVFIAWHRGASSPRDVIYAPSDDGGATFPTSTNRGFSQAESMDTPAVVFYLSASTRRLTMSWNDYRAGVSDSDVRADSWTLYRPTATCSKGDPGEPGSVPALDLEFTRWGGSRGVLASASCASTNLWADGGTQLNFPSTVAPSGCVTPGWECTRVDTANDVGAYLSLAMYSGNPRIAYQDSTVASSTKLLYSKYVGAGGTGCSAGAAWNCEIVTTGTGVGDWLSLALTSAGDPRVSFQYTGDLAMAKYVGAGGTGCVPANPAWTCLVPDTGGAGTVGQYSSIALDSAGLSHFAYYDAANTALRYAKEAAGAGCSNVAYTCTTVDLAGTVGQFSSLALDAAGIPHIAYRDTTNTNLKHARYVGGGSGTGCNNADWTCITVDASANDAGWYLDIAIDSAGNPGISYVDVTTWDLMFVRYNGASWDSPVAIETALSSVFDTSIAFDGTDARISYWDGTDSDLRLAKYVGSGGTGCSSAQWRCGDVDSSPLLVGQKSSIAVDGGSPKIAYYDATLRDLKYVTPAAAERWITSSTSFAVTSAATFSPAYYRQFETTHSLAKGDPSDPHSVPSTGFTCTVQGSAGAVTSSSTPATRWCDNGQPWSFTNPIVVSGTEEWRAPTGTSGTVEPPPSPPWTNTIPDGAGGSPARRDWGGDASYDAANNRLIVFGGRDGASNYGDTWVLTAANGIGSPAWSQLTYTDPEADGEPGPRFAHSTVYDAELNRLILWGGYDGAYRNDLWVLKNANGLGGSPSWQLLLADGSPGQPGQYCCHDVAYDPSTNRLLLFAGYKLGSGQVNEYWILDNANGLGGTPTWTQLSPSGGPPPARAKHSVVYDRGSNRLIAFGNAEVCCLNDVWVIANANGNGGTPTWSNVVANGASGSPAARGFASMEYDHVDNRLIIFGGSGGGTYNDVWVLTNANGLGGTPRFINTVVQGGGGSPSPRYAAYAAYDRTSNRLMVFGGTDGVSRNDVWVLREADNLPYSIAPAYFHQYEVTLSISKGDSGEPHALPTVTVTSTSKGSAVSTTVTTTPTAYFVDDGAAWSYTNPVTISGTERWSSNSATSGFVGGAATIAIPYWHQYGPTFAATTAAGGTLMSSPGNCVAVTIRRYGGDIPVPCAVWEGSTFVSWVDHGANHRYTGTAGLSSGSSANERWTTRDAGVTTEVTQTGLPDSYAYRAFDTTTSRTILAGDFLEYDIRVTAPAGEYRCGLDAVVGGSRAKDVVTWTDQNGKAFHPATELTGYADGIWYHRRFDMTSHAGQSIGTWMIGHEGNAAGSYVCRMNNVVVTQNGQEVQVIYRNGASANFAAEQTGDITSIEHYAGFKVTGAGTYSATYYHQYRNTVNTAVASGGSALACPANGVDYGWTAYAQANTRRVCANTFAWADRSSTLTITKPTSGSTGSEKWDHTNAGSFGVTSGGNLWPASGSPWYNQLYNTWSVSVGAGGNGLGGNASTREYRTIFGTVDVSISFASTPFSASEWQDRGGALDLFEVAGPDDDKSRFTWNQHNHGWTAVGAGGGSTNGVYAITSSGTDPQLFSPTGPAMDFFAGWWTHVSFRMRCVSGGSVAKLYFITSLDGVFNDAKSKTITVTCGGGVFRVYDFWMGDVGTWAGTITRIRLDPMDVGALAGDTYDIDWLAVTGNDRWVEQTSAGDSASQWRQTPSGPGTFAATYWNQLFTRVSVAIAAGGNAMGGTVCLGFQYAGGSVSRCGLTGGSSVGFWHDRGPVITSECQSSGGTSAERWDFYTSPCNLGAPSSGGTSLVATYYNQLYNTINPVVASGGLAMGGSVTASHTYKGGAQNPSISSTYSDWADRGTSWAVSATSSGSGATDRWALSSVPTAFSVTPSTGGNTYTLTYYHQYKPTQYLFGTKSTVTVSSAARTLFGASAPVSGIYGRWSDWADRSTALALSDTTTTGCGTTDIVSTSSLASAFIAAANYCSTPIDFQRGGSFANNLRPEFIFYYVDLEGDRVRYHIQLDDDSDFTSLIADADSGISMVGFTDLTTPAEPSPFPSGDLIRYTVQSDLVSGRTYYSRLRVFPVGDAGFTPFDPRSHTVDPAVTNHRWQQTANTQFDKDALTASAGTSRALSFDGVNDYVSVASPTGLPTGSTVSAEAWIYPKGYPDPSYNGIVSYGPRSCTGTSLVLSIQSTGRPSMATWCNDFTPGAGPAANLNQWNHVAVVVSGTSVTLYLNGATAASGTLASTPSISSGALGIGITDYPGRYFNGYIDEVRIYGRALPGAEVTEHYGGVFSNNANLAAHFHMDETSGTTTTDSTSNLNVGTFNNGVVRIGTVPPTQGSVNVLAAGTFGSTSGSSTHWSSSPITVISSYGALGATGTITSFSLYNYLGGAFTAKLKILRSDGTNFIFVGESAAVSVPAPVGTYTFATSVAAQAGDYIGLYGDPGYMGAPGGSFSTWYLFSDVVSNTVISSWTTQFSYRVAVSVTMTTGSGTVTSTPVEYVEGPVARNAWRQASWTKTGAGSLAVDVQKFSGGSWVATGISGSSSPLSLSSLGTEARLRLVGTLSGSAGEVRLEEWSVHWSVVPTNDDLVVRHAGVNIADGGRLHAGHDQEEFVATVSDPDGTADVQYIDLRLDGDTSHVARWTRTSDSFSESSGGADFDILSTGADTSSSGNQWTVIFRVKFGWNLPWGESAVDPAVATFDSDGPLVTSYTTRSYWVENDLVLRETGLRGHWRFDEGSGTSAGDSSGLGNAAALSCCPPVWVDGKVGKALSFDGIDDSVSPPSPISPSLPGQVSVSAWARPGSFTAGGGGDPLVFYQGINGEIAIGFRTANGRPFAQVKMNNAVWYGAESGSNGAVGEWYHLALVFDGVSVKLFVNGTLAMTTPVAGSALNSIGFPPAIGRYTGASSSFLSGAIDEVRYYERALGAGEVADLAQREDNDGRTGLVARHTFDENSGTSSADTATGGNPAEFCQSGSCPLAGPAWVPGKVGNAAQLDGTNDFLRFTGLEVDTSASGRNTIEFWMDWAGTGSGYVVTWSLYNLWLNAGTGCLGINTEQGEGLGVMATDLAGEWHHVAVVFPHGVAPTADNSLIYIDGISQLMTMCDPGTAVPRNVGSTMVMGADFGGTSAFLPMKVDEVMVWNRPLGADEVARHAGLPTQYRDLGLAIDLRFEEFAGSRAGDSSGNNRNGTMVNGPAWQSGRRGGALSFDGVDDYVSTAFNPSEGTSWTAEAWINLANTGGEHMILGTSVSGIGPGDWDGFWVETSGSGLRTCIDDGPFIDCPTGGSGLVANTWYHVAFVRSGSTLTFYIDGASVGSAGLTAGDTGPVSTTMHIGRIGPGNNCCLFAGAMDEVRFYYRALPATEVAEHAALISYDRESGKVLDLRFDETGGPSAYDSSRLGHTGTLTFPPTRKFARQGLGLDFSGAQYVEVPHTAALMPSSFSAEAWVYPRSCTPTWCRVLEKGGYQMGGGFGLEYSPGGNGRIQLVVWNGAVGQATVSPSALPLNAWTHVVATFDGANSALYLNGALVASAAGQLMTSSSGRLTVGRDAVGNQGSFFDGLIDQVRIYSRPISATEVEVHFYGSPRIVAESGLRAVSAVRGSLMNDLNYVGPGETITWSGVTVYYEGTTATPPDSEFDLSIQENPATTWTQSTGATLNLATTAPSGHDEWDVHNLEIVNVPGGGPHGKRSFLLRIDATAPGAPTNVLANGASPSAWTDVDSFTITATAPLDLTGVPAAWFKKDSVPTSPGDGTRTDVPFVTSVGTSGVHPLYLWGEDGVGNKDHTARAQVDLRLDINPPAYLIFEVYEDSAWRPLSYWQHTNQTPWVRVTMSAGHSGLQVSSVQWRYSTDGGGSWSALSGSGITMHTCASMSGCPAADGATGTLYARIPSIPFNQDSGTQNQFQVQARKMSGPSTTTIVGPQTIKIDTIGPGIVVNTATYSHSVNPLPAAWVDVDFTDPGSGLLSLQARFENGPALSPWYTVLANMGGVASYTTNFNLWTWAPVGTSTVRLRLTDLSGNTAENTAVTYEVIGEANSLSLRLGTNFIGTKGTMTTPWGNLTIIQLGREIFNDTGRVASRVAVFESGAWIDVTSVDGVVYVGAFGDRTINDGMGVLVKMTGAGSWPVSFDRSNRAITSPVNRPMSNGFHFISVPEWTGGGTRTASQLGDAMSLDAGAGCYSDITYARCAYSILKWNPTLNRYMEVLYGGEFGWTWTDTDLDTDPNGAFIVKLSGVGGPGTFTFTP